jgi:hypothetical protein
VRGHPPGVGAVLEDGVVAAVLVIDGDEYVFGVDGGGELHCVAFQSRCAIGITVSQKRERTQLYWDTDNVGDMQKTTRGRPPIKDPLGRALAVRFTVEEEALVREAADGKPVATFIREAAVEAAKQARG